MNVNNKTTKEINSKYGIVYERDENGNLVMKNGIRDDTVVVNKISSTKIAKLSLEITDLQEIEDNVTFDIFQYLFMDEQNITFSTKQALITIFKEVVYINTSQNTTFDSMNITITVE